MILYQYNVANKQKQKLHKIKKTGCLPIKQIHIKNNILIAKIMFNRLICLKQNK